MKNKNIFLILVAISLLLPNIADARRVQFPLDAATKEVISQNQVEEEWDNRANNREGVTTVMSNRYTSDENLEFTKILQEEILEILQERLEGKRVFEFGFGIGRMTSMLAEYANEVVGIDISSEMLKRAAENLSDYKNITLIHNQILNLNFPPKSFDLLFECTVLIHILNQELLQQTVAKMKELSDTIVIIEPKYYENTAIGNYTNTWPIETYIELFSPYRLTTIKTIVAGDEYKIMIFENPDTP